MRRSGAGVPGSMARHSDLSTKAAETFSPTSVTSAASSSRSRSRRISVPLVRIENGFAASRSAAMMPAHELVPPLGPLVAVDVGAHRDVLARPAGRGQLRPQQFRRVDLDHDPRVEVPPRVHVQVRVRVPRETVPARMLTSPIGIDGIAEHHAGGLGDLGHDRLRVDLVEGHAAELGRVERPRDRVPLDQRERRPAGGVAGIVRIESQAVPAHDRQYRTSVRSWQTCVRFRWPPMCGDYDLSSVGMRSVIAFLPCCKKSQAQSQNDWINLPPWGIVR